MTEEKKTLGELLFDPRIGKIAPDAIRNRDLSREESWNKTPQELLDEHFFFGDIGRGFRRLFDAARSGIPPLRHPEALIFNGFRVFLFPGNCGVFPVCNLPGCNEAARHLAADLKMLFP